MNEFTSASLVGEKVTEIDDLANGMSIFRWRGARRRPMARYKVVEESESLRISAKCIARERRLIRSGLWSLLRVACAKWMPHVARIMRERVACRFFPLSAGVV